MSIQYSPYDESLWSHPWDTYRQMQDEAPAYFIEELDCWALTRFEDIWNASMDRNSYTAKFGTSPDALFLSTAPQPEVFLFMDPPAHGRTRGLIGRSYMKDKIALVEDHVRGVVQAEIAPMLEAGQLDVYRLASRTALRLIAAFIGLEYEEALHIRGFIDRFYLREPGVRGTTAKGGQAFAEAREYILDLIDKYRKHPPAEHSHIVTWLNAEIDDKRLTDEQIFFSIFAMVITGSDTLPLTTACTIYNLAENPQQLDMVRDDPTLCAAAFEEAARFDQPTNMLGRRVCQEVELHGETMRPGQSVLFLYAAACRDEREFDNPALFDITRRQRRNLSFGTGLHFCLGQHLARLEGKVLLQEILSSVGEFEVQREDCERITGEFLQGYCRMPITFRPSVG